MRKTELFKLPDRSIRRIGNVGYLAVRDALSLLNNVKDGSVDLVFLDPPFNLGKQYAVDIPGSIEEMDAHEYSDYMMLVLKDSIRVLRPGGSLFLYHLPIWAARFSSALSESLDFRHWIAISMKNGFVRGKRLYPAHYALLYFTKGDPTYFRRPRIDPSTCRHCGGYIKDYGGYRSIVEEKGLNLSDVWDDLTPVRHRSNKHRKANQLPTLLTDRVVEIAGPPQGVLLDPFVGTGTSLVSAVHGQMRFVGGDLSESSVDISRERVLTHRQMP